MHLLLGYLFGARGKHRVTANCDPRDEASIRLLRSLGFRQEGLLRESAWEHGEWTDAMLFALLDYEWRDGQCRDQR